MAPGKFDLQHCLTRVREHDQDAARELVEALYPLVIRIVRTRLPWRAAEEDLAQEVFLKLFARLDQYQERPGVPFEHWVSRLTVRTCLDALRAQGRRPEWRMADLSEEQCSWLEFMVTDQSPLPDAAPSSALEVIGKLLEQLSPEDEMVIRWLDLEEKTVREIAQLTGWSSTRVKVRAFRARRKLRKLAEAIKE